MMTSTSQTVDPCIFVIFGASGDLTARKLIPAMYEMAKAGLLPKETRILGVARREKTDDQWREEPQVLLQRARANFAGVRPRRSGGGVRGERRG